MMAGSLMAEEEMHNTTACMDYDAGTTGGPDCYSQVIQGQNPRASFLGLPTEMRLRIYEHLFEPIQPLSADHCCHCDHTFTASGKHAFVCSMHPPLQPGILSTNKQICNEATSIFYKNIELFSTLPKFEEWAACSFDDIVERVPKDGLSKIRAIAFATSTSALHIQLHDSEGHVREMLAPLWSRAVARLPDLEHVRLTIDLDDEVDLEYVDFPEFLGILDFAKLKTVMLQGVDSENEESEPFWRRLKEVLEKGVERIGKKVDVMYASSTGA